MGVLGASLEIFDFFPGVPGPFAAFDDLLILFRTEEDLFFVFGTGLLSSCSAFDDLRAFAFADFPVFAGGRFAFSFEFFPLPAFDVFDRTVFLIFFPTLPGRDIVAFVFLVGFIFRLTEQFEQWMSQIQIANCKQSAFRGRTKLFKELPLLRDTEIGRMLHLHEPERASSRLGPICSCAGADWDHFPPANAAVGKESCPTAP